MSNEVKIVVHDPVYSSVEDGKKLIAPAVQYSYSFWQQGQYRKIKRQANKVMIGKNGTMYTGLVPRVSEYCFKRKIPIEIVKSEIMDQIEAEVRPSNGFTLHGIKLRPDQERMVKTALREKRGILTASPGMGKTVLALSILKAFDGKAALILVPNLSLLEQTKDELDRFGFQGISVLGGNREKKLYGRIVLSTVQTCITLNLEEVGSVFDLVLIDEAHLSTEAQATLEKILQNIMAPYRIGFTATVPKELQRRLTLEGVIGPVIDEVTWKEGQKEGLLTEPYLKLVSVPANPNLSKYKTYQDIYKAGIVEYTVRNRLIVREALSLSNNGLTSLIFVKEINHGQSIYEIAKKAGLNCVYLKGDVDSTKRNECKKQLEAKEISSIICTSIFREGVNMPSLNAVILAAGGKSEIALIQTIGRALRRSKGKNEALIIDFLDIGKFLSEHCIERFQLYNELGIL